MKKWSIKVCFWGTLWSVLGLFFGNFNLLFLPVVVGVLLERVVPLENISETPVSPVNFPRKPISTED